MAGKSFCGRIGVNSILSKWDVVVDGVLKGGNSLQEGGAISCEMQGAKA